MRVSAAGGCERSARAETSRVIRGPPTVEPATRTPSTDGNGAAIARDGGEGSRDADNGVTESKRKPTASTVGPSDRPCRGPPQPAETDRVRPAGVVLCDKTRPRNQTGSRSGSSPQSRRTAWVGPVRGSRAVAETAAVSRAGRFGGRSKQPLLGLAPIRHYRGGGYGRWHGPCRPRRNGGDGPARSDLRGAKRACTDAARGYPSTPLLVSRTGIERTNPVRPRRFAAGRKLPPSDGPQRPPLSR